MRIVANGEGEGCGYQFSFDDVFLFNAGAMWRGGGGKSSPVCLTIICPGASYGSMTKFLRIYLNVGLFCCGVRPGASYERMTKKFYEDT